MNYIAYICWLLMVHPPINVFCDFVPIHSLAKLKTNAPDNTSELTVSRELLRSNYDPKNECDFELADRIPICCNARTCPLSMKNPTSYKRKSRRYHSNKKEIKYDYFHGEGVVSCKMQIKPNDHCCLFENRCYGNPYSEFIYFKYLKTESGMKNHENDLDTPPPDDYSWSTTSKRKRTVTVPNEYDWSTTSKRKNTVKVQKCDFEIASPIPDCCQPIGLCSHSIKPPTYYKRRAQIYESNEYDIYYEYFEATAVYSCNIEIKPNDYCCLWEHLCYRHPYFEYIYFKFLKIDAEADFQENDKTPDDYDWSTTLKHKKTDKTTSLTTWKTKTKKKKKKIKEYNHKHEHHHHHHHTPPPVIGWWNSILSYFYEGKK